jgi:TetR/AcrR family transcriptional regulator
MPPKSKSVAPRVRNAAASRTCILEHAIAEFATQGVAGARTASIAETAGVNKALLYYYFKDKESLYSASLQAVFGGLVGDVLPLLESTLSPGEKILRMARVHFEYLIHHPNYPRLIQQELSRAGNMGEPSSDFRAISKAHFIPLQRAGIKAVEDGIATGEFRKVEGVGALAAIFAMNVFYFISAPIMRLVRGADPFSPECLRGHIATSLDFVGASLFTDRKYGIKLAKKIATAASALPRELRSEPRRSAGAVAQVREGRQATDEC